MLDGPDQFCREVLCVLGEETSIARSKQNENEIENRTVVYCVLYTELPV